jgi:drug/metabolite transporter (DMT)-like permease
VSAALLATLGLYLMTAAEGLRWGFSRGDFWILLCALSYAIYILVLQRVLRHRPHEVSLAFTQIVGIALYAGIAMGVTGSIRVPFSSAAVITALLVCALLATVGTFWLQTRYQGRTSPQRVALIFSLEPVFAAFFAWWLLAETLSTRSMLGAGLILVAVLGAECVGRSRVGSDPVGLAESESR